MCLCALCIIFPFDVKRMSWFRYFYIYIIMASVNIVVQNINVRLSYNIEDIFDQTSKPLKGVFKENIGSNQIHPAH